MKTGFAELEAANKINNLLFVRPKLLLAFGVTYSNLYLFKQFLCVGIVAKKMRPAKGLVSRM